MLCQALATLSEECRRSLARFSLLTEHREFKESRKEDVWKLNREVQRDPGFPNVMCMSAAVPQDKTEVGQSSVTPVDIRTGDRLRTEDRWFVPTLIVNVRQRFYAVASGRKSGLFPS